MKVLRFFVILAALLLLPVLSHAGKDTKGSKDHPLFTRMPGTNIEKYQEVDFVEEAFRISKDYKEVKVEGYKYQIGYHFEKPTSWMNISRNYTNAIKKIGGEVIFAGTTAVTMRLAKDGKEVWAGFRASAGGDDRVNAIVLTIVEKEAFVQQITASDLLDSINKTGYVAVYINFDTGKSEVKPESMPDIEQIAALLKSNPSLNISVEGHTDNVGDPASNKTLSERRAQAVQDAVAGKGIAPTRMSHAGHGQNMPIADNRIEEGRAKNRRVELVKK